MNAPMPPEQQEFLKSGPQSIFAAAGIVGQGPPDRVNPTRNSAAKMLGSC